MPLKVFIPTGQFNMKGEGSIDHDHNERKGNPVWAMANPKIEAKMRKLKSGKGAISPR